VILIDAWLRTENVYESCRRLTGKTRCRTYIVTDGATATPTRSRLLRRHRHVSAADLGRALARCSTTPARRSACCRPSSAGQTSEHALPERLLRDLVGEGSPPLSSTP
jgi:hypothetical protein